MKIFRLPKLLFLLVASLHSFTAASRSRASVKHSNFSELPHAKHAIALGYEVLAKDTMVDAATHLSLTAHRLAVSNISVQAQFINQSSNSGAHVTRQAKSTKVTSQAKSTKVSDKTAKEQRFGASNDKARFDPETPDMEAPDMEAPDMEVIMNVTDPENDKLLFEFANKTPFYLLLISLGCAIVFLALDHFTRRDEERTCFNRLHDWEEGQGRAPGFAHVLDYVKLDSGGGLHKLEEMIPAGTTDWTRLVGVLSTLFFAVYNVYFIFDGDMSTMVNCAKYELTGHSRGLDTQYENLLSAHGVAPIITDARTLLFVVCAEMIGLTMVLVRFLSNIAIIFIHIRTTEEHFQSFSAMWAVADGMKFLCTYSMLKLLWLIHPTLVARELKAKYHQFVEHHEEHYYGTVYVVMKMVLTIFGKLILVVVLFVSFGVKVAIVSTWIHYPNPDHLGRYYFGFIPRASVKVWGAMVQFVMQALGAMQLDRVMLQRVFEFVFAGSDAILQKKENIMLKVYKARVAQVIYEDFWLARRHIAFFSLMGTLDDVDMQGMLLHEEIEQKMKRMKTMDARANIEYDGNESQDPTSGRSR